jgi:transcriptional regulator with XRE-family HTH domain
VQDPVKQRWLLQPGGIAARLRKLQGDISGVEFARRSGLKESKISKLRRGQQMPEPEDIRIWVTAAGADHTTVDELMALLAEADMHDSGFERTLRAGQEAHQRDYNELVQQSNTIRMFERTFIPRLLQTFDYARAILARSAEFHKTADDIDAAVNARLECQRFLTDGRHEFQFIIDQAVLTRRTAPAAVMQGQMYRLLDAVSLPNVRIAILPVEGDFHEFPRNSFELYGSVGIVETSFNDDPQSDEQWRKYREVMDDLWQDTVEGEAAEKLIRDAMRRHAKAARQETKGE